MNVSSFRGAARDHASRKNENQRIGRGTLRPPGLDPTSPLGINIPGMSHRQEIRIDFTGPEADELKDALSVFWDLLIADVTLSPRPSPELAATYLAALTPRVIWPLAKLESSGLRNFTISRFSSRLGPVVRFGQRGPRASQWGTLERSSVAPTPSLARQAVATLSAAPPTDLPALAGRLRTCAGMIPGVVHRR
jgi:hypothetical protein